MEENIENLNKLNIRQILLIVLIIASVGIIVLLQSKDTYINRSGKTLFIKSAPAPDFTLPDLDGNMTSLSDYKGKVVLLNIWATWCPPCVEEMPSIERLHQELKNENFKIIAVSIDSTGTNTVASFMEKHKLNFHVLTDTGGTIKNRYRTTGIPESLIIDKNGNIVEKIIGPRDWSSPEIVRIFRTLIQND